MGQSNYIKGGKNEKTMGKRWGLEMKQTKGPNTAAARQARQCDNRPPLYAPKSRHR
ncbi:MAG: hypothetical protein Gyms2KO_06690 [Gymnodinialimonas sp.]